MPLVLHRQLSKPQSCHRPGGSGLEIQCHAVACHRHQLGGNVIANAAEQDGSVLAYRQQTNGLWTVNTADNPDLANFSPNGIGGPANAFNNFIRQNPTNSQVYTLFGSDGSQRISK